MTSFEEAMARSVVCMVCGERFATIVESSEHSHIANAGYETTDPGIDMSKRYHVKTLKKGLVLETYNRSIGVVSYLQELDSEGYGLDTVIVLDTQENKDGDGWAFLAKFAGNFSEFEGYPLCAWCAGSGSPRSSRLDFDPESGE